MCGTSLTLALQLPLVIVAVGAFVGGFAGQVFVVLWMTTLQTEIPSNMLSRVSAYDHLGSIVLAPLGIVIFGFLYEKFGETPTMTLAVFAIIVPTCLVLLVPEVRNLRKRSLIDQPSS